MHKEKHTQLGKTQFIPGGNNEPEKVKAMKKKVTKLGRTAFIVGGNNEPTKTKMGTPEFVRDEYEQGVAQMNKGASNTSLIVTHGRK